MAATHDAKQTTNHDEIRRWAESRGGRPATVKGTEHGSEHAGVLRIAFTDEGELEPIDWDEFFDKFERERLAFLYQDQTSEGGTSRFFKLVQRH